jgi:putative exosortase-associated protein (TIGR04073 family)
MKNAILILGCILALAVTQTGFAQTEEAGISTIFNTGSYRINSLKVLNEANLRPSAFLKSINTVKETNTYQADSDSPANKGGVGAINALTAWVDIPTEVQKVSEQQDDVFAGCTLGLVQGVVYSLQRGTAGVYDMATFGLPPYDQPVMEPAYKVEKPQDGFKVDFWKW